MWLIYVYLISSLKCVAQISQNTDSTIVGVVKLCCCTDSYAIDSLQIINGEEYPLHLNLPTHRYGTDSYGLFVNMDSTELLFAIQAPGMNRGQVGTLIVVPVCSSTIDYLQIPQCTYMELAHFQTDQGVRVGLSQERLFAIKGNNYHIDQSGNICYTHMSSIVKNDVEAYTYCVEHNVGDLFLNVAVENGDIAAYELSWSY